jgi:mono/diheme cytochrome c family protein
MRVRTFVSVAALIFLAGGLLFGYYLTSRGFSARGEPSRLETFIARNLRSFSIPSDAKATANPNALTPEKLPAAQDHWVAHCSTCHGLDGTGDTTIGKNLFPKPPDMRSSATQDLTDGEIYYIISNGVRFTGMPAWGEEDSAEDIWDLVSYIRRLPNLSPEELKLLERKASGEPAEGAATPAQPQGHTHAPGTAPHTHAPSTPQHTHAPGTPPHTH